MTARSRRAVLAGLTGVVGVLAGCSSGNNGVAGRTTTTRTPESGSVFESTAIRDGRLTVTLRSDSSVDRVNLIAPDGSLFAHEPVAAGQTRVAFTLVGRTGPAYRPGEQTLVAVTDDEVVAEYPLDLTPAVRITDVVIARDRPDLDWNRSKARWRTYGAVIVENLGTGPDYITRTRWKNNPLSVVNLTTESSDFSGGYIDIGAQTVVYSRDPVFGIEYFDGLRRCQQIDSLPFEVEAITRVGSSPTWTTTIRYDYQPENGSCYVGLAGNTSSNELLHELS